jgi:outer membrane autotransporter protein
MARVTCLPTTLLLATPAMLASPAMAMNGIGHGTGGIGVGSGVSGVSAPGKIVLGAIQAMLTGDSRFFREAALARTGSPEPAAPGAWGEGYAGGGRMDGAGTSGGVNSRLAGGVMGADAAVGDWGLLGLAGGYRTERTKDPADAALANVSAYQAGAYASGRWNAVRLTVGAAYEWNHINAERSDSTGLYAGRYGADLGQVFGEAGYRLRTGPVSWEPYLGAAWTSLARATFTEAGGAYPFTLTGGRQNVAFVDIGARARMDWQVAGVTLHPNGALAWRRAYGQLNPGIAATQAGTATYLTGDPIDRAAAHIAAGLDVDLPRGGRFGLGYDGQIARGSWTDVALAKLSLRF